MNLLWRKTIEVEIIDACQNFIHTACCAKKDAFWWDGTFACGNPVFRERRQLWLQLQRLYYDHQSPWLCIGNFNEILHQEEKDRARPHSKSQIDLFREFLHEFCLMDLVVKGCKFIWTSNLRGGAVTRKRIARTLANGGWRQGFPNACLLAIPLVSFDHCVLVLNLKPKVGDIG